MPPRPHRTVIVSFLIAALLCIPFLSLSHAHAKNNDHLSPEKMNPKEQTIHVESAATPNVTRSGITAPTFFVASASPTMSAAGAAPTLGPNLIPNGSVEASSTNGLPTGWKKGGYGTNTRVLSYPVSGVNGGKAIQVVVSDYVSGDAKWYFTHVPVTPGKTYQFSDYSLGTATTEIDAQYLMTNGTYTYAVLAKNIPASTAYQNTTVQFTIPQNVQAVTMFHLIKQNGSLTTDEYTLQEVQQQAASSTNLVPNGDFETANGSAPSLWSTNSWGSNTASFTYPTVGVNGSKAAQVSITQYTKGDAKWYFAPLSLAPGIYTYSDMYQSNVPSVVDIQIHNADGTYSYKDLAFDSLAPSFSARQVSFVVPQGTQDITVFRLIQGIGTLTIDNVVISKNTTTNGIFQTGAVTLTFDDGWASQYTSAFPELKRTGIKGTFYIITHQLADYGYSGFMSKAQIINLYTDRQEIGGHTQTHPHLTQLSASQQSQEITSSRLDLLALNVGPINSFAYPYGDYNATTISLVKQAGFTNARSTNDGYTLPDADHYQLSRLELMANTTFADVQNWIDQAIAQKAWLILAFHQIDTSGEAYSTTPTIFSQILDYLVQKKVVTVTMDEGFAALNK